MASLRPRPDRQDVVSRRLALLSAELAEQDPRLPADDLADLRDPAPADVVDGHTRIRPLRRVGDPEPVTDVLAPEPPTPVLPVPGRHAARRLATAPRLPEAVRGRLALGPGQLVVVAALVAVGIALAAWWAVHRTPERLEAPVSTLTPASAAVPTGSASPVALVPTAAGAASGAPSGAVIVDVAGKVRRPGIVELDAGSRVVDAIEAAGGARRGVDLSSINLARLLVDGEQILVGAATTAPSAAGAAASSAPVATVVNINTASETELETLPQVGPVTAAAITSWRDEHGGFSAVDELLEVDGIGDATLAQIAPLVTV